MHASLLLGFTAKQSCNFESPVAAGASVYCTASDGVLGWEEQITEGQGSYGASTAAAARQGNPDRPLTDYNPGTENGNSVFVVTFLNFTYILQAHISTMQNRSTTSTKHSSCRIQLRNSSLD